MNPTPFDSHESFIYLLGRASDDAELERFLVAARIHGRPMLPEAFEDVIEDDGDTDVEYERAKASSDSLLQESERLGFSLIFVSRHEYELVHRRAPVGGAPFVLSEVVFFEDGIGVHKRYQGILPGGLRFGMTRQGADYHRLGHPMASRRVYDTPCDLFVIDGHIINVGSAESGKLVHVHMREQHVYDKVMLAPQFSLPKHTIKDMTGGKLIGLPSAEKTMQAFLRHHGMIPEEAEPGACPAEVMQWTESLGMTLYFDDGPLGQQLSEISYKRRGDLGSQGYNGPLPMGFAYGDAPETLLRKAGRVPIKTDNDGSGELMAYYWKLDDGSLLQAVCSLIEYQLYRINVFAQSRVDTILES